MVLSFLLFLSNLDLADPSNLYELLGVSPSADAVSLRKAFCRLSKILHPDTTSLPLAEAATKFQQVCEAYDLLGDPVRRRTYDEELAEKKINNLQQRPPVKVTQKRFYRIVKGKEVRRPLSGGELFSLLLILIALFLSLFLGVGFAFIQGREFQSVPSWLIP